MMTATVYEAECTMEGLSWKQLNRIDCERWRRSEGGERKERGKDKQQDKGKQKREIGGGRSNRVS